MSTLDIGQIARNAGAPMPGEIDYLGNLRCGNCVYRADRDYVQSEDDCYHPQARVIKEMFGFRVSESDESNQKIPANFPYDKSIVGVCDEFVLNMQGD